ncbi:MAG: hypothetical protein ACKVVT_00455 [Dehalococcoidia bacterium]
MTTRQAIHETIDYLPDDALDQVEAFLREVQLQRIRRAFENAPPEDEELLPHERESLARGEADMDAGRIIHDEDLDAALDALTRAGR